MDRGVPEISIVVPAFEAAATIADCVSALAAQTLDRGQFEIIVVDDASTDETAALAARAGARVLRLPRNVGPAAARNAGVAAALGELIVFTDADCQPTADFLAALTARVRKPGVGGAKGIYLSRQLGLIARFVQSECEATYRHTARQASVDFVDTSACCFHRDDVQRVGGFDPGLRMCEDQELSFRLAAAGVRIEFAPEARTYHLHCERWRTYLRRKFHIARWKVRVLRRHPSKTLHDSHTPPLMKLELALACAGCASAALCTRGRWRPLALVLAAYAAVTAPFMVEVARRDPMVALAAPALLLGRDLALGAGLLVGVLEVARARRGGACAFSSL